MSSQTLPVAIIGAGPVGLAAAAHLIERGETPLILEAGQSVGHNIMSWAHVRMFSPWEFTVDSAMVRLLEQSGWEMPALKDLPTGGELVTQFLRPFADLPAVKNHIRLDNRVIAISRRYVDKMKDARRDDAPFVIHIEDSAGQSDIIEARAVIDASGTWHKPNPIGAHGLFAVGERQNADHITYGIPDIMGQDMDRYGNQRVLVVGSGHSAINAVLDLGKLRAEYPDTKIYWAMRGTRLQQVYGGETDDQLPARGALGTRVRQLVEDGIVTILSPFYLKQIAKETAGLRVIGHCDNHEQSVLVDEIIATTGARPDLDMLRELRLNLDSTLETTPILAPMIDPNLHSCGTVPPHGEAELRHPEKDFYVVGMKSYGRAPSFLLATGYEQARSVVAYLTGDYEAAREVQLNLPETGVCSTDFADDDGVSASCCGTTAPVNIEISSVRLGDIAIGQSAIAQPVAKTKESGCC